MSDGMKRIITWLWPWPEIPRPTRGLALGRNPIGMRANVQRQQTKLSDRTAKRLLALNIFGIGK